MEENQEKVNKKESVKKTNNLPPLPDLGIKKKAKKIKKNKKESVKKTNNLPPLPDLVLRKRKKIKKSK